MNKAEIKAKYKELEEQHEKMENEYQKAFSIVENEIGKESLTTKGFYVGIAALIAMDKNEYEIMKVYETLVLVHANRDLHELKRKWDETYRQRNDCYVDLQCATN